MSLIEKEFVLSGKPMSPHGVKVVGSRRQFLLAKVTQCMQHWPEERIAFLLSRLLLVPRGCAGTRPNREAITEYEDFVREEESIPRRQAIRLSNRGRVI